jgi:hypothetical protein
MLLILNSKHFVESTAVVFVEGILFFPFIMQPDRFSGPAIKGPGGGKWVVGISIYNGIKKSFLQSFFKESYGADVIEWYSCISSNSFKI